MTTVAAHPETAGVSTLIRFILRRERRILPWWLAGVAALMALQSVSSQNFYDTPAKLAQLRATMAANAAVVAMGGPTRLLQTVGGEVVFEVFAYLAVVVSLMNMFLIGRNTRTDEELGRAELIRSAPVGRHSTILAALITAMIANCAVAVIVSATAAATGLPAAGSVLVGVSVAGIGFTVAAATTVAAQIFENPRTVYGAVTALIAAMYVARAVGDAGRDALAWASPIGWGQRTYPYVDDRWWPVALFAATSAILIGVAFAVSQHRDFGAGLLGYRPGRGSASVLLGSPLGLVWRLQRGPVLGWATGAFLLGAAYGSFADSIEQFLADNPDLATYIGADAPREAVDSYLAFTLAISALLAAACGIAVVLHARSEESAGRSELILAGPVGRVRWLTGYVAVASTATTVVLAAGGLGEGLAHGIRTEQPEQALRLAASALGYLPAVWVLVAATATILGWAPDIAAVLGWTYFTYVTVALLFVDAFDLPGWLAGASPLRHTAPIPLQHPDPAASAILLAVTAAATGIAWAGIRHRDVGR
ncbi:ABC transporter permease [Nocardia ignorata]|uniref:ABC-2 type transport system permease protein n=1 Tax=Nocardia ignorata TaxID=145285 RepID=A0A4R6P1K3_NOCIG|nr:ABC transporter permease [Nocardia ignorata]TDP31558.1 ABC-2 type transport system permease protein [Nocardia ignorata]